MSKQKCLNWNECHHEAADKSGYCKECRDAIVALTNGTNGYLYINQHDENAERWQHKHGREKAAGDD